MNKEQAIISELLANINEDLPREQWTKHMLAAVQDAEAYLEQQQEPSNIETVRMVYLTQMIQGIDGISLESVYDILDDFIAWQDDVTYVLLDLLVFRTHIEAHINKTKEAGSHYGLRELIKRTVLAEENGATHIEITEYAVY